MKFRLGEGQGECIYEIGVEDDGSVNGIPQSDMKQSLENLEKMAKELNAEMSILLEKKIKKKEKSKNEEEEKGME